MRLSLRMVAALAVAVAASAVGAHAKARLQDFVVAGHDGYGTQECLVSQSSCGRIVADAWCEAKGFRSAQSYRAALPEDFTNSISDATATRNDAFIITCKD